MAECGGIGASLDLCSALVRTIAWWMAFLMALGALVELKKSSS